MLIPAKTCRHLALRGLDADVGRVKDFFIDERSWAVRYLVADTGNWLRERRVLLSPHALRAVQAADHVIPVDLTRQQIEASPPMESDEPLSKQWEDAYHRYFGWPGYWAGSPTMVGGGPILGMVPPVVDLRREDHPDDGTDPHLLSSDDLIGHRINSLDGDIGHLADVIISDDTWSVAYIEIDTGSWLGRKTLIARDWLERVSWSREVVQVHLHREAIRAAPVMPANGGISAEYEVALHQHYALQPR
jgi:hypothetical protein